MTALVFVALMAFSVVLAFMAKRGVIADSMDDVMVAGRSFGAFMVFFVTVGETYGIGTMIGVPANTRLSTSGIGASRFDTVMRSVGSIRLLL